MSHPDIDALRALYERSPGERIAELVEAANALTAGLQTLRTTPTPYGAERIAAQLHGMHLSACATVDALARQGSE